MTAEQEKQISEIRAVDYHETSGIGKLLSIIDDLQKQQPKRYTEAELRAEFEKQSIDDISPPPNEPQIVGRGSLYGWVAAFRFLGMIKTERES